MSYTRGGYRRGYGRRAYAQTTGRVQRANKRPGPCHHCGETVPAYGGQLWREESGEWSAVHSPAKWAGSPTSGQYVGGCPAETDETNRKGNFGGQDGPRPERERLAAVAATGAAMAGRREAPRDARGGYVDECGSCGMASCSC